MIGVLGRSSILTHLATLENSCADYLNFSKGLCTKKAKRQNAIHLGAKTLKAWRQLIEAILLAEV
jgi:hypothetical protein